MLTKTFILGGKAIFTVHNDKGVHYTYRVTGKKTGNGSSIYFVNLLTGPDNESDYTYLGVLDPSGPRVRLTAKSKLQYSSVPVRVLGWVLNHIWTETELPDGYGVNHEGRCGRCGRTLTRPEGVDAGGYRFGFGPECWGKV